MNWNRPQKGKMRTIATRKIDSTPYQTALMFPGEQQLCIKQALRSGIITKKTFIYAVEKDPYVTWKIREYLDQAGFNYYLHEGDLFTFKLPNKAKIDYAFVDLCGPITPYTLKWLHDNQNHFMDNCRFIATFSTLTRGMSQFVEELNSNLSKIVKDNTTIQLVKMGRGDLVRNDFGYISHHNTQTKQSFLVANHNVRTTYLTTVDALIAVFSKQFDLQLDYCNTYKENGYTNRMFFIHGKLHSHKQKDMYISIRQIIKDDILANGARFIVKTEDEKTRNRRLGAIKAWKTMDQQTENIILHYLTLRGKMQYKGLKAEIHKANNDRGRRIVKNDLWNRLNRLISYDSNGQPTERTPVDLDKVIDQSWKIWATN